MRNITFQIQFWQIFVKIKSFFFILMIQTSFLAVVGIIDKLFFKNYTIYN